MAGRGGKDGRVVTFMSDVEWAEIKRVTSAQHGTLLGAIEDRILTPLDYSPALGRSLLAA
jgi:hypothetical protein